MSLYSKFKTSTDLETNGIYLDLGFVRIKVARAGGNNQKYNAVISKVSKQHGRAFQHDLINDDRALAIMREVYADTVILDWETRVGGTDSAPEFERGIEDENGEIIEFNRENVIKTLTALPDLLIEIKNTAENITFFRQSILDEVVKN